MKVRHKKSQAYAIVYKKEKDETATPIHQYIKHKQTFTITNTIQYTNTQSISTNKT